MVLEHGSPFGMDGQCVVHVFMSISYVFLILVVLCLLHLHGVSGYMNDT